MTNTDNHSAAERRAGLREPNHFRITVHIVENVERVLHYCDCQCLNEHLTVGVKAEYFAQKGGAISRKHKDSVVLRVASGFSVKHKKVSVGRERHVHRGRQQAYANMSQASKGEGEQRQPLVHRVSNQELVTVTVV